MAIGISLWALMIYLTIIVLWCTVVKRNIGEGMLIALIAVCLFGGKEFLPLLWGSVQYACSQSALYAALLFVFMSYIMNSTGIIQKLIHILNSLLGRIRGGSAFVSVVGSAVFGAFSGSPTGCSTTIGSITIPWMLEDGWSPHIAATMNAGNAGLGIAIPPCSSMFLLLGIPVVAASVTDAGLFAALWVGGLWNVLYRIVLVFVLIRRYNIKKLPSERVKPFRVAMREGWTSLFLLLGIALPVILTVSGLSAVLASVPAIGSAGMKTLNIVILIPVFITIITLIEGRKRLPKGIKGWYKSIEASLKNYSMVGGPVFFSFCACFALDALGLADSVTAVLASLAIPKAGIVILVSVFIVLLAGPLNSTAVISAVGSVCFTALTNVGIAPVVACVAILLLCSTEGASPPSSTPCYLSCGIARCRPDKTFLPLILYYCLPCTVIAVLVCLSVLPV